MKKRLVAGLLMLSFLLLTACGGIGTLPAGTGTGGNAQETAAETLLTLFSGGEDDYAIIYSASATDCVSQAVLRLRQAVASCTGKSPITAPDNSKKQTESGRELLIGVTTREESRREMEKLDGYGWRIAFSGGKPVVCASSDRLLAEAVERLMGIWISENGRIGLSDRTELTHSADDEVLPLTDNGKARFKVIIPQRCSDTLRSGAAKIATALAGAVGVERGTVYTDAEIAEQDGAYEVCIGKTTRAASERLYGGMRGLYEGKGVVDGTRIVLGGMTEETLSAVVNKLYEAITAAIRGAYSGGAVLAADWSAAENPDTAVARLPAVGAGTVKGVYDTGKETYILYVTGIALTDYTAYLRVLQEDGCTAEKSYTLGDNRYSLMKHETYTAYVSYLPQKNAMRIAVGEPDIPDPTESEPLSAAVCEPTLWQLDVDNYGSKANGGMSYVIQLTDGSFLVVDGGYSTQTEATALYEHLVAHTPKGQKPVISAWFITHGHIDHYGALMTFSGQYANAVDVRAFYYNLPYVTIDDIGAHNSKSIEAAMARWGTAKRYSALHSGMKIGLSGAAVTVLCTFEDVYPLAIDNGNDTSLVFRVDVGGQRILFTGDAMTAESVTMTGTIPREELKSDIVQVSHHGYEGCDPTFYGMADPEVLLWPMPVVGYQTSGYSGVPQKVFAKWYRENLAANKYLREQVGKGKIKKIFCMGDGTVEIRLPYTPTGRVVPDYDSIYGQTARKI